MSGYFERLWKIEKRPNVKLMLWILFLRTFGYECLPVVPMQGHPKQVVAASDRQIAGYFIIGRQFSSICLPFHCVSEEGRQDHVRWLRGNFMERSARFRSAEMIVNVIKRGQIHPE